MKTPSSSHVLRFAAAACALASAGLADAQNPVKAEVSGKFVGNGKDTPAKFVLVQEEEPFNDKEAIRIVFTEKDPSKSKKPDFDASFGKLGSALVLSVHLDGGIFGCEVAHSAHKKQGFTSLGRIKTEDLTIANGSVSGRVTTGGELDTFGEKWEVDLKFTAPMPEKSAKAPAKPAAESAPGKGASEKAAMAAKEKAPTGPAASARKLPLPKDATDIVFKEVVNQIQFSSARPVDAVAKEFSASLKEQGWKDQPGSLMGKTNAILRRELNGAKLTIMVQPAGGGSMVRVMCEGLDWSNAGGDSTSAPAKPAAAGSAEDEVQKALKEAQKALQDALK